MAQIPHLSKLLMHLFYSCATDNFALLINFLKLETKLKAEKASPYPFFTNSLCQKLQRDNNGLLVCFTQPTQCFSFEDFDLFLKKMQSIEDPHSHMAEITKVWVVVPYQQWSLIIFPQYPISLSFMWVEFVAKHVAPQNKDCISQCSSQLGITTLLFWPMRLGKVGNFIIWHFLLNPRYAVCTLNTYFLNE